MKKNVFQSLPCLIWILSGLSSSAQTWQNFNSLPSVPVSKVKKYLHNNCSLFVGFEINANGWNPNIEGDGAMVSENNPLPSYGISPVLAVNDKIDVSFSYKFNNNISTGERRWLKIYLADANNMPQALLDSLEFQNINTSTVYKYNKTLSSRIGEYKIYFSYHGIGGSTAIALDQLQLSAPTVYKSGCNDAPVALNDHITGFADRSATGTVMVNDSDPNGELVSAYLIKASAHGTIALQADGSFHFTPNAGFKGTSTSFTYKICDQGSGVLCSNDATVSIQFPHATGTSIPVSLVEFNGSYKNKGKVQLNWVTNFEKNSDRFEVERSFDGNDWEKVGALKAQGISSMRKSYSFTHEAGRNTALKKDLYYRIKQVDLESNSIYTKILIVRVYNTHSTRMISVTPNPAKNDIGVNVQLNENSFIVMKVIASNGVEAMRKSVKASAGFNSYSLEGTSQFQSGAYLLEVIVNSKERMMVKLEKE